MKVNTSCYFAGYLIVNCILSGCSTEKEDARPNILLIMVDDMGFSDPGCYGGEIHTPNIDRLAENGIRFTRFYNTAKSFPSRACLLTGQYAQHVGMGEKALSFTNAVTIAEVLKMDGYRTLMTGKHHGDENPVNFGFDRYFGLKDGCCNYFNPGFPRNGEPPPAHKRGSFPREWCIDSILYKPYTPEEKDFYTTDYFTNYAISYLEEYKNENKPFFLYLSYTAPHDPLMAWPEDINKYLGMYMGGYDSIRLARFESQKSIGLIDDRFPLSDPTYEEWNLLTREEKLVRDSIMATFAAMIDRVDQNIGRILDKLEELNKSDNTIILFMSDNGAQAYAETEKWLWAATKVSDPSQPVGSVGRFTSLNLSWANVSNTPFRLYKGNSHEGGISTPLIIYWKGKISKPGRISDYPSHLIDIMPTLLEITGSEYPAMFENEKINPMDGISLLQILYDRFPERIEPIFWQWQDGKAIRKDNWKLVSDNNGPWELYDMSEDQTETSNLIIKYPEVAGELKSAWERWITTATGKHMSP